ncbi:enoyl-CoA hydratase-related protein [Sphingobium sp. WCS2017Hpa-17]|uniref:enoyl-CoA hydratase-related protein n=1 Tax=Sphingobium sp. WCS2017Hpa-17 TaxID=3073638 RepID=UPI00288ADEEA|nr:enoyl-CoA hydratase-related protein [Sphingobium sp. WCS2017Hpa-17]
MTNILHVEGVEQTELETVAYTIENGIAWVSLNRPDKRNCMSPRLNRQMMRVLDELEFRDDVGVLVLTGEGTAWTAGMPRTANCRSRWRSRRRTRFRAYRAAMAMHPGLGHPCPEISAVRSCAPRNGQRGLCRPRGSIRRMPHANSDWPTSRPQGSPASWRRSLPAAALRQQPRLKPLLPIPPLWPRPRAPPCHARNNSRRPPTLAAT